MSNTTNQEPGDPAMCAAAMSGPLRFDPAAARNCSINAGKRITLYSKAGATADRSSGEVLSKPLHIGAGQYRLTWRERWTVPVSFRKYAHNPVYSPDFSPDWDSWTNGVSIIPCGEIYRMFYAGREGEGIGLAEASVDAPTVWQPVGREPLLRPLGDGYEGQKINQPRVVKLSADHWRMFYTGWGYASAANGWCLCAADSYDAGLTWKRIGRRPLLELGRPGEADDAAACVPTVLIDGGRFRMWYTAVKHMPAGGTYISLCYAESADGLEWEKYSGNPVLGPPADAADEDRVVVSRPSVRKHRGVFRMWYSYARPRYRIHYAESPDGTTWECYSGGPVLDVSPAGWDSSSVEYPVVDERDGRFRLWYCGDGYGSVGYAEGDAAASVRCCYRQAADAGRLEAAAWTELEWDRPFTVREWLQLKVELSAGTDGPCPAADNFVVRESRKGSCE